MPNLESPDIHCLQAAVGWMELGAPGEAEVELQNISPANQRHPSVLEVRWRLFANALRWDDALQVARDLLAVAPKRPWSWLHHAYALRRANGGGLQQAWDALLPAQTKFPKEPTIPYNIACYACQLGNLEEARNWFQRALEIGNNKALMQMALDDADLKPLWDEIRKL